MVKPVSEKSDCPYAYQKGYKQALDDFGITELRSHLSQYSDADFNSALMNLEEQELESLAAILIQRLTKSLKGKLIASYLNAIRHGNSDVLCDPINQEIPPPSLERTTNFLDGTTPRYAEGDRVQWRPLANNTDRGVVLGHFYTYAQHQCQWAVCYLIWLDEDSPSSAWTVTDTAWEEDLEPIEDNGWKTAGGGEMGSRENAQRTLPSLKTKQQPNHSITALPYPLSQKSLHTPSGSYSDEGGNRTNPRSVTQREENLINLYSHCQLGMTPSKFYSKWSVSYDQLACICSRSMSTVRCWFTRGRHYRRPTPTDLRHLAVMDFLLEHFEAIPQSLFNLLCPRNHG